MLAYCRHTITKDTREFLKATWYADPPVKPIRTHSNIRRRRADSNSGREFDLYLIRATCLAGIKVNEACQYSRWVPLAPLLQGFRSTKSKKPRENCRGPKIRKKKKRNRQLERERDRDIFTRISNETLSLSLSFSLILYRATIFVFETRYKPGCRIIATNSRRDGIVNILKSETTPVADCSVFRV